MYMLTVRNTRNSIALFVRLGTTQLQLLIALHYKAALESLSVKKQYTSHRTYLESHA
jgi:hypothetical protein